MSRVLIIADPHEPYTHPKYIDHCRYIRSKYKTVREVRLRQLQYEEQGQHSAWTLTQRMWHPLVRLKP